MSDDAADALPVVEPPTGTEDVLDGTTALDVAGVLLAAGTSTRFGAENKLLADVDGVPMVRRSALALLDAGVEPIVAVVGYESARVRDALDGLDVRIVENPAYETGQASTVRRGVESLEAVESRGDVDAAVFALGDMPYVEPTSIESLVAAYAAGSGSALAAGYEGNRGNPVLFDERYFVDLASVDGDVGGREILERAPDAAVVETGDPGVRRDVDEPSDFDGVSEEDED